MPIMATEKIQASPERVWEIITDIENAKDTITGITALTVLERPATGVIGLKWKETRKMFGKDAEETMWITGAEENQWYETRAESNGAIYKSRFDIRDAGDGVELAMSFESKPVTLLARMMSVTMFLFAPTMKKLCKQDLQDIKRRAEG